MSETDEIVAFTSTRVDFNFGRWAGTDQELNSQTSAGLERKGYKKIPELTTALTKDTSLLQTSNGFRKDNSGS